jgi:hypothetical protein
MRHLVIFLVQILITLTCFAQKDDAIVLADKLKSNEPIIRTRVLSFYPGFWAPGMKFESASQNHKVSYGLHTRGYIFLFNGVKFEPFIRYYFKKNAPEGVFLQFKISGSLYNVSGRPGICKV